MIRFHTQAAGCTVTAQQPMNNIVRVAFQALSAILEARSLHANSMDEVLCLPSEQAVQVTVRAQQLIASEMGVADTVDPMGGSNYVGSLTRQIYEWVDEYIQKIDDMGVSVIGR